MKTPFVALLVVFCVILSVSAASPPRPAGEPPVLPGELSTGDWSGIRAAHAAWEHSFHEAAGGYAVRDPGHKWRAHFDSRGFTATPEDGTWQWGLELGAWGFPDRKQRLMANVSATKVEGSRLTRRWDDNLQERYMHDPRGLEHGFTIAHRPGGSDAMAPLVIELTVRGSLQPQLSDGGRTATFVDAAHHAILTYSGLKVWDADGRLLPARMTVPEAARLVTAPAWE